jgi:hypothetical protein
LPSPRRITHDRISLVSPPPSPNLPCVVASSAEPSPHNPPEIPQPSP